MKLSVIAAFAALLALCLIAAGEPLSRKIIKKPDFFPIKPGKKPPAPIKSCDKAVADVMLVLDDSSSVGSTNFKKVKRFAQNIVKSFNIGRNKIRVGAITFSGKVKLQFKMNKYYNKRRLLRAISRIKYKHGGTNTNRALDYLRTQSFRRGAGDRKGVPNIAIVLTDGKSNSLSKTKIAALKLRKTGAIVFAIGVGKGIKRSELNVIGSSPRRNYVFSVKNFNVLSSIAKQLIKRTCNVPVLPVPIPARPCVCSASGDPHYKTFDGQMIHFMGTCKYTLVTPHQGSNYPHFKVEVKNEHRGRNKRVSYTRLVDVKLGNNTLRLLPRRRITVNGVRFQMPINNYLGFTVKYAAGWVRAETAFGLLVKFDGNHRVIVKVPGTYRRELTGICGDCNGKKDDWRTKAGVNVSKRRNKYSLIGKSYEVPDDSDKPQKKCQTTDVGVTCKNRVIRRCKEIIKKGGIFKKCLKSIFSTAVKFYQSCKIDVCAYNKDKKLKKEVLCRSFEAFAQNCENIGVLVNWRKALKCKLKCPKNMVYKFSTPIYQPSCSNRRIPRIRKFTEGCVCKKGFILSGTECVPSTRCGCKYKGLYMKRGSSFLLDDCSRKISCRNNGRLRISRPCHKYSVCQVVNGDRVCKCKKGHVIKRGKCVAPAPITTTTAKGCEKAVADVMLVLDDSGSVGSKNFAKVKTFAQNIVKSFNIGRNKIRVGAITFSNKVKLQFRLNRYYNKKNVLKAINRIKYKHGSTNTHKALDYLRRLSFRQRAGDRKLVPNIAIVLTDGKSNNLSKTKSAALKLRKTGAIVFAIGVGKRIKRSELNVIGSSPRRNHVFSVKGFNVLNSIVKRLTKRTCNVHPCDAKPCKNGGVCRRRGQTYKCSCRRGFVGRQCTIAPAPLISCEKAVADVMLVLDDSGSVGSKNFAKVKTFAQNIVKSFNIGRNKIRVGAITFSHRVKLQFRLNRYYNKNNVLKAINRIKYKHGSTNTHKALDYLRRLSFRRRAGDRKLVPNIAIVLTDGKSNSLSKTKSAALKLRKTGAIVFAIGVGKRIKRSELNVIGSSPRRNHVFSVKGFNVLNSIVKRLTKRTCNVHPCDAKPCKNGGVCRRRGQTYKCSCRRGFVGRQCTIVPLPPAPITSLCQCRAVGDPHYRTFDGQMIHFMGSCKYTLASTINGTRLSNFNVEVKNEHRGYKRVSYTRLVDIKINGVTLRLYPKHRIAVNNELLEMPLIKYMGFTVVNTGGWVIATTTFGLLVKFDGNHRVIVQVPSYYKGQLTGICGDCNGRKDDWRTKTGVDVTRKRNKYSLIGKSYAVIDDSDKPSKKCEVTDPSTTCSKSVTKVCDYMKNFNGVFKRCIIKLGIKVVQQYIQSCKIDACAYKTVSKTLKEVTCRAYEGLVRQCEDAGVLVNWRGVLGCRLDCSRGKNMMYKVKIAANQPTCFNRNPPAISYYSDGCVCKPNYILSGNECVPKSKCGCMYKGMYIKAHTSVLSNDCSRSITCLSNGKYTTKSTCPKDSSCLVEFGRRTCKCASGFAPVEKECKKTSVPPPSIINPAFLKPVLHRFFRVTVAYIVGKPLEESTEKHVEQCAHKCLKNKKCKSFNFDELEKKCQLYDISAATVTLKPSECPYKEYFQLIESRNVLIKGATIVTCVHLDEFSKINSEEKCKAKCSEKKCKAMEYSRFFKQCGVTHKGLTTYGLVGNMFWKFSVTLDTLPGVAY